MAIVTICARGDLCVRLIAAGCHCRQVFKKDGKFHMLTRDVKSIANLAVSAARAAGTMLGDAWRSGDIRVKHREHHDVKLAADVESEKIILSMLREQCPEDGVLAEESGASGNDSEGVWIVDPLDGTVNFSHGHPHFSVSIAWCRNGVPTVGVVYDPVRDELFSAVRGQGAWLNGRRIRVSDVKSLDSAMLAVGFGKEPAHIMSRQMSSLAMQVQKLRIGGSAALDMAYAACGRLDGYSESRVFVWDLAAASVIITEAGGHCRIRPTGEPYQRECMAANPAIEEAVCRAIGLDPATFEERWVSP
jgi:myo-inositol-1(or 4)-monophosphatase